MGLAIRDFAICAGDDLAIPVTVTEDGLAEGAPISLVGLTGIAFAVADFGPTKTRRVTKTLGAGVEVTDAAAGKFLVTLTAADTTGLSGPYRYQARLIDAGGNRSTVLTGTLKIRPAILEADE